MRLKSTPSRFMGENNSALEANGYGLASNLDEIDRPVETDGEVAAYRDVDCTPRLIATREQPHRGFEQPPPDAASPAGIRHNHGVDGRDPHLISDHNRSH